MARGKITVYMDMVEIADLDQMSVAMRREGLAVDRGRLVRAALALAGEHQQEWLDHVREVAA